MLSCGAPPGWYTTYVGLNRFVNCCGCGGGIVYCSASKELIVGPTKEYVPASRGRTTLSTNPSSELTKMSYCHDLKTSGEGSVSHRSWAVGPYRVEACKPKSVDRNTPPVTECGMEE